MVVGRHELFHQMGWSWTTSKYQGYGYQEIYLEKYCHSIWNLSDNDLQFDSNAFRRYYYDLGITNRYSTSAYPQGNGQAKAVNKVIINGLIRDWVTQRENGWKSCHMSLRHIRLHLVSPLGRHIFQWLMGPRFWFLWRQDFQHWEQAFLLQSITMGYWRRV